MDIWMKEETIFLKHIQDSIAAILKFTEGITEVDFLNNRLIRDATIRNLEIIGEAAKNISSETRKKYPDIPFRNMAGMRDKLIHHYFGVDFPAVWEVVEKILPNLESRLEEIIKSYPKS
jgi:uncharacterized protein with HEPN domain